MSSLACLPFSWKQEAKSKRFFISHWSCLPRFFHFGLMKPRDAHFAQLSSQNDYQLYRPKILLSQKKKLKKLLDCYCSIFPFLLSWGCININEMLKEKKKRKKGKWNNKKKGFPKQIITIQSLFREKLWLCYIWIFPIYFALAKLCANDGSPYVYMNAHCQTEKLS